MVVLAKTSNKLIRIRGFHIDYLGHAHPDGPRFRLVLNDREVRRNINAYTSVGAGVDSQALRSDAERPLGEGRIVRPNDNLQALSRHDRMQVRWGGLQRTRNSAMKYAKIAAHSQHRVGSLTALTFVRAARFVTLLVGATTSFEFLAMAVVLGNTTPILIGLVLLLSMTLAIWTIAVVLGTILLVPKWIWAKTQDQLLRTRCWTAASSSVWDEWINGPSRA